jgi:exodeoxyribonuclease V gamma subunit
MLNIYQSNQMERLVDALGEVLSIPLPSPKMPEWVGVQTQGLGIWLGMALSRRLGIWANVYKPFPRALIERLFKIVLGEKCPDTTRFEPALLTWSIMTTLPGFLDRPEFSALTAYLTDDVNGLKRFQLARRIAETFDRYAVYRPEMVLRWESGTGRETLPPENRWQPILWRALVEVLGPSHVAAASEAFFATLRNKNFRSPELPPRIALFGISSLPPLYLNILSGLPEDISVNLFLLNPSREFWAYIRSRKEIIRELNRKDAGAEIFDEALYFEEGHPLLSSLGRMGRDFQCVLEEACDYIEPAGDLFTDPLEDGGSALLHQLQSDILNLRLRRPGVLDAAPLQSHDESVSIHNCHGPMREVQVLYDRLMDIFQRDMRIAPHDVIVMVPDIAGYAPVIEAVFGAGSTGGEKIPFTISDRGMSGESPVIQTFLRILRLARSRFPVEEVLDLLAMDAVAERFFLSPEEMALSRHWLLDAGIRWGISGDHRAAFGQPALHQNTWRFGLDRLLLGIAMPDKEPSLFYDTLPYAGIEGKETEVLGHVVDFCETLFSAVDSVRVSRSLTAWQAVLGQTLAQLVAENAGNAWQHRMIREALGALGESAAAAGAGDFSLAVAEQWLTDTFQQRPAARGFLSGGVTFCNLLPMRSIPFKVVCLMGMNDGDYPRNKSLPGFDLTGAAPRLGDRSVRNDDRYLFLEALLSARERFMVFYAGQAIRDNSVMPPSVVVGELLDVIEEGFFLASSGMDDPGKADLRDHIVTTHPLHPFSPAYFDPERSRLFSYSRDFLEGARALVRPRRERDPFLSTPLAEEDTGSETIYLSDLIRFFSMPVDFLLRNRLGIVLDDRPEEIDSREPLSLTGLDRFYAGESLLDGSIRGNPMEEILPLIHAKGVFPPGSVGQCTAEDLAGQVVPISEAIAEVITGGSPLPPLQVNLVVDGALITGEIEDLWPAGRIVHSFGSLNERRKLSLWIYHLLLNRMNDSRYPRQSLMIGRGKTGAERYELAPVPEEAKDLLSDLVALYRVGFSRPLPFFPATSYAYAAAWMKDTQGGDTHLAMSAALKKWRSSFPGLPGEGEGLGIQRVFGEMDPSAMDAPSPELSFTGLAIRVCGPMIRAERSDQAPNGEGKK